MAGQLQDGAPANVSFVGRIGGEAVDQLLRGSRAAVLPSECVENAPMAVLEAMMLGRPVVASSMGGIPEQVRDGIDGLLVQAGATLELATALRTLADSPGLADSMGRAAHERATALYGPEGHTNALLDVYRSVLRSRTGAAGPV